MDLIPFFSIRRRTESVDADKLLQNNSIGSLAVVITSFPLRLEVVNIPLSLFIKPEPENPIRLSKNDALLISSIFFFFICILFFVPLEVSELTINSLINNWLKLTPDVGQKIQRI